MSQSLVSPSVMKRRSQVKLSIQKHQEGTIETVLSGLMKNNRKLSQTLLGEDVVA